MAHIVKKVQQTYAHPLLPPESYPSVTTDSDKWCFFPCLPIVCGKGNYAADHGNVVKSVAEDACRKASYGHPTLTPGIFTIKFYCQYGECYGFQTMRSCESPRHPFDIFTCCFNSPLQIIVYDNACKLHIYCLNREPAWYSKTRFFVVGLHWRGHVGCTRGYRMDSYKTRMDTRSINSQANEQANSGLQRIKGQLAYMKPSNFMLTLSLLLAITNQDKIRELDVSTHYI